MRFSVSTAAIVVGFAGLVFSSPAANKATDDGPVWTVQVFPNEEARVFTGDALDVYAQVKALNPNFGDGDNSTVQDETSRGLSERSTIRPPDCWDTFLYGTHYLRINEASQAMKNLNAPVGVAARSCVRLACIPGPNAGFALCNDNYYYIEPNSRYLVTDYVYVIMGQCTDVYAQCAGQEWDTDQYNVIVKAFDCNRPQTWPVGQFPD